MFILLLNYRCLNQLKMNYIKYYAKDTLLLFIANLALLLPFGTAVNYILTFVIFTLLVCLTKQDDIKLSSNATLDFIYTSVIFLTLYFITLVLVAFIAITFNINLN